MNLWNKEILEHITIQSSYKGHTISLWNCMIVHYTVWGGDLTNSRSPPPSIDFSSFHCNEQKCTLYLNCQRQEDPLIGSSQVIAMQMRFFKDKLATLKERPCPQWAVCLVASPKKKKSPILFNKRWLKSWWSALLWSLTLEKLFNKTDLNMDQSCLPCIIIWRTVLNLLFHH